MTALMASELNSTGVYCDSMDWVLPGIAPTGRRVEVALVAIIRFREGKLAHEHIYGD
jgi:carboxymethylenebutenolidase